MKEILKIKTDHVILEGELALDGQSRAVVIFSHGSGSSRFSPRNNFVASYLRRQGIATFLVDLLTEEEDQVYHNRFDIQLLSRRLVDVTRHLISLPPLQMLPFGYFGASTGAASAIVAASVLSDHIKAIVSRGGRPDLASDYLETLRAPILLIVGGHDHQVIALNREALQRIHSEKSIQILEGATHLFEEPGMLEEVARLSANWFQKYLSDKVPLKMHEIPGTTPV